MTDKSIVTHLLMEGILDKIGGMPEAANTTTEK